MKPETGGESQVAVAVLTDCRWPTYCVPTAVGFELVGLSAGLSSIRSTYLSIYSVQLSSCLARSGDDDAVMVSVVSFLGSGDGRGYLRDGDGSQGVGSGVRDWWATNTLAYARSFFAVRVEGRQR